MIYLKRPFGNMFPLGLMCISFATAIRDETLELLLKNGWVEISAEEYKKLTMLGRM